jgi:hypothetical protein
MRAYFTTKHAHNWVERLWLWSGAIVALLASTEKAKITVFRRNEARERKVHRSKTALVASATVGGRRHGGNENQRDCQLVLGLPLVYEKPQGGRIREGPRPYRTVQYFDCEIWKEKFCR